MRLSEAIARQEGWLIEGSVASRNNNPGNIKFGKLARAWGAVNKDKQGHAIFPSIAHGKNALVALLCGKFAGKSLREIGEVYAEDKAWAKNVARIMEVDIDNRSFEI